MRKVTYEMSASLDGYVVGPDGTFDWGAPTEEEFRFFLERLDDVGVHVMGRRLHETMLYWETTDRDGMSELEQTWADRWNPLPKLVLSTTLESVHGAARLATDDLATEIARLRESPEPGDIAIGGATVAAEAARLGLIDEYRLRLCPVLVGGGLRYFAHDERRADLELLETRRFDSGSVFLRYRVLR